jgi:outer membrane protein OmpA-like peptidoglycan-associated protein
MTLEEAGMKKLAILAALLLAGCTAKPVNVEPPPVAEAPPAPSAPAAPPHAAPPPPVKHEQAPPLAQGPLTAKLAGAYMDGEETELRKRLSGSGLHIARIGDAIAIDMQDDFLFDNSPSEVSWEASGALSAIASVLAQYDHTLIEVGSYTDTAGSADSNLRVSQLRAKIIADVLAHDGVAETRITAKGFGETHLLVPTGGNVGQKRNRRVQIRIVPKIEA